ncbi:hypothetical protein [Sporomusa termitida]|uniref:Type 4 fimbrial biogenesis protein PilX N-terminal domain-containing protein n=1 Tax=Sporomusa termitida TaxID=2377 RepID=A0A517DSB9_9FIRM|nr:hypothetical protein [Sporomusa termitida]QDR80254.1 hypothetical protein SPTER_15730 [Sporomusa termitida]
MRHLRNQSGLSTMLALFIMAFAGIIVAGLTPMVTTQLKLTSVNKNLVEAQFVAEAGAKRAIVAIANGRTDWGWINNDSHNSFDGSEDKYYIVKINPPIDPFSAPEPGNTYTITSEGYVGDSQKTVTVNVKTGSQGGSGIYNYSAFSNGTLDINSTSTQIIGDIASNTIINLNWSSTGTISGYAYAPTVTAGNNTVNSTNISQITAGAPKKLSNQGTIDIPDPASLMPSNPMANFPTLPIPGGTNLKTISGNTLSQSTYYCDGSYVVNKNYTIPPGNSVTIYVNGTFTMEAGSRITGGNVTIYAKNGFSFTGGSINSPNGTINLYTSSRMELNSAASYIKGNSVTIYAVAGIPITGGYIETGNNGTVNLYTSGSLTVNSDTYVNGKELTVVATTNVTLNGGSINKDLSDAVTKIYTRDFTLNNSNSVISGKGVGMVSATNNISLSGGTAPTTLMIAGNYINANNAGVTVAGLYSNNTIFISGVKILHSDLIAPALNLSPGSGPGSDFSVLSWSN